MIAAFLLHILNPFKPLINEAKSIPDQPKICARVGLIAAAAFTLAFRRLPSAPIAAKVCVGIASTISFYFLELFRDRRAADQCALKTFKSHGESTNLHEAAWRIVRNPMLLVQLIKDKETDLPCLNKTFSNDKSLIRLAAYNWASTEGFKALVDANVDIPEDVFEKLVNPRLTGNFKLDYLLERTKITDARYSNWKTPPHHLLKTCNMGEFLALIRFGLDPMELMTCATKTHDYFLKRRVEVMVENHVVPVTYEMISLCCHPEDKDLKNFLQKAYKKQNPSIF